MFQMPIFILGCNLISCFRIWPCKKPVTSKGFWAPELLAILISFESTWQILFNKLPFSIKQNWVLSTELIFVVILKQGNNIYVPRTLPRKGLLVSNKNSPVWWWWLLLLTYSGFLLWFCVGLPLSKCKLDQTTPFPSGLSADFFFPVVTLFRLNLTNQDLTPCNYMQKYVIYWNSFWITKPISKI